MMGVLCGKQTGCPSFTRVWWSSIKWILFKTFTCLVKGYGIPCRTVNFPAYVRHKQVFYRDRWQFVCYPLAMLDQH